MSIPVALTIAGSDSSGGAGIQADLKTFFSFGVYGATVITAITAQNTVGVFGAEAVSTPLIESQISAVFSDFDVAAVKTGMLWNEEIVRAVARELQELKARNLVIDPVIVAKSGAMLLDHKAISSLITELFPLAAIITPNIPEAARILGLDERAILESPVDACKGLLALGPKLVVLKGGHASGKEAIDFIYDGELRTVSALRCETKNTHGTGCSLSAAICAGLAMGHSSARAIDDAKAYLSKAISSADTLALGHGHGPINHWAPCGFRG